MNEYLEELVDLISQGVVSGKTMEATLGQLKRMMRVPDDQLNMAQLEYESRIGIIRAVKDPAAIMSKSTQRATWYVGPKAGDVFWPGVRDRLKASLDEEAIIGVDRSSSKILSVMSPPGAVEISTRGLVLGYVQSGKTTSFISVIGKAADAGYRVFIVLSGVTDNLRSQTQGRIDDLLIGPEAKGWYKLTSADSDFAQSTVNAANLLLAKDFRFIAVVKKNPARLRRLRDWLNAAGRAVMAGAPVVLIDDEADQASIDVSKPGDRTSTINGLLREILHQPKAGYIAYTATPFANLLINPGGQHPATSSMAKDLYPSDFIVPLPKPEGYFGAERMFGRSERLSENDEIDDGMDVIRNITIVESELIRPPKGKGAVYSWKPAITGALADAIRWFLLSTAARRIRKEGSMHSTMLVHSSMLAEAHLRLAQVIVEELDRIRDELSIPFADGSQKFKQLYETEISKVKGEDFGRRTIPFEELADQLIEVALETRVIVDNYLSVDRLSYDDQEPTTAIVVGGNTLSRGLTLEGLSSSYFVRSASAYDTLLQMGRWFGYRRGYEDLCRLWMTEELRLWFRDLSLVEAEIRSEMERYELENLNPLEVAVRIRTHPDMAITAAAKMRGALDAQMSFSTMRPQTILFARKDKAWLDGNIGATKAFIAGATAAGRVERQFPNGRRGLVGVDARDVLQLISRYNFHPDAKGLQGKYLAEYIRNENSVDSLLKWNVVVVESATSNSRESLDLGLTSPVRKLERSRLSHGVDTVANLKAIVSTMDRVADLELLPAEIRKRAVTSGNGLTDTFLEKLRSEEIPNQGLICIYPIDKNSTPQTSNEKKSRANLEAESDLVGLAFFFPRAKGSHSMVSYKSADLSGQLNEELDDELAQIDAADAADDAKLTGAS